MKPKLTKESQKSVEFFDKLIGSYPDIGRKGATMPYASLNGNMFIFLTKDGTVNLRLPDDSRESFLKKYKTTIAVQYGAVMKEYAVVPDALLKKTSELKKYLEISFDYVKTLKSKPTKRK